MQIKIATSLLLMLCSVSLTTVSTASKANAPNLVPGINLLQQNIIKSFLQKANDSKSILHKKLVQLNQQYTDGRNRNGVLPKTLNTTNIQTILIAGEDQYGSYCNLILAKPGYSKCENGVSENYLILIPYKIAVHKALEYQSFKFTVKASKKTEWKIDEKGKVCDRHESIKIDEPVNAVVKIGSETY